MGNIDLGPGPSHQARPNFHLLSDPTQKQGSATTSILSTKLTH
jgi:hypothetical protein